MIKFHPNQTMLSAYSAGELPLSLSIAISAHIELCDKCAQQAIQIEEGLSQGIWQNDMLENADFGDMLQAIMTEPQQVQAEVKEIAKSSTYVAGREYLLPTAFRKFKDLKWSGFGVVSRARIINDEQNVRASLLHIDKNGRIPEHKHKGYELTLLLEGSFSD
jgi:putative transcriptional regulator